MTVVVSMGIETDSVRLLRDQIRLHLHCAAHDGPFVGSGRELGRKYFPESMLKAQDDLDKHHASTHEVRQKKKRKENAPYPAAYPADGTD